MPYLIDSDVLIDLSRDITGTQDFLNSLPTSWAISQISSIELIVGARNKQELIDLDAFLSVFPVVPLTEQIGSKAYDLVKRYAKSHGLHVFDSLIAASAIEEDLTLVSKNRRHFEMIEDLQFQSPDY